MEVANLVLPVFAIIVTGWLAGWLGYVKRSLAAGLVHFAYNVAMPALLLVTIAQEKARSLLGMALPPGFRRLAPCSASRSYSSAFAPHRGAASPAARSTE